MPPTLMSVVINRSESGNMGSQVSKQPSPPKVNGRTYEDGPLPIQASDHAPLNARIVNRVFEGGVVTFQLKIGDTILNDVRLEELLEYVSARHLEEYENEEFKQEGELLRIAEEGDRRYQEERARHKANKERKKTKGIVIMQETSDDDREAAMEEHVESGKHGRPRPSYKRDLVKVRQRARRRKRDPITNELMPLSDDEEGFEITNQQEERQESSSDDRFEKKPDPLSLDSLPKRRRRRRDPATGELMPLAPIGGSRPKPKTDDDDEIKTDAPDEASQSTWTPAYHREWKAIQRRRRHPITNLLMPLGWRYDPEAEKQQKQAAVKVPSMQRLSISKESEPKRRRLERTLSRSGDSRSADAAVQSTSRAKEPTTAPLSAFKQGDVISLHDSDSEESAGDDIKVTPAAPKPKLLRRGVGGASVAPIPTMKRDTTGSSRSAVIPVRSSPKKPAQDRKLPASSNSSIIPLQVDDADSSSGEEVEAAAPPRAGPVTSILHPSAAANESSSSAESDDDDDDENLPEDEYFVQAILGHAWSNPVTHPTLGIKAVMLYKVKWEGWVEPTWEPKTSFGDLDVVRQYQKRVGMKESERDA